ncbi:MAG TPA: vWA domain-containing protein [Thermoanaerobaculia bacterium]|nr:vWA domain-containing protein [Thermoanaerobaculia bacterium]
MATTRVTTKKANSESPQIVTLIVDDSGSMSDASKCQQATAAIQQLVMEIQAGNLGSGGYRYLVNIAKFGDSVTILAECAPPDSIDINTLQFTADSGGTTMVSALEWATVATDKSIRQIRAIPRFKEEAAPNPIVVFFSDGENTGPDVTSAAAKLKNLKMVGGPVDVVACGIGMSQAAFDHVMKVIASREDLAVNINPAQLGDFIAEVKKTVVQGGSPDVIVDKF